MFITKVILLGHHNKYSKETNSGYKSEYPSSVDLNFESILLEKMVDNVPIHIVDLRKFQQC